MKRRCLCLAALALALAAATATTTAATSASAEQLLQRPPAPAAAVIEAAVADSPDLYSKFDFAAKRWPGGVPPLRDEPPEDAFATVQYAKNPPAVKARGVGRQSVDEGGEDEVAQAESDVGALDGERVLSDFVVAGVTFFFQTAIESREYSFFF
jgi:hypothetical protein